MNETVKNICLFAPLILPIPNVKGGAIETLITNLIACNEKEKKLKLTVISIYDKEAEKMSKQYPSTNFIYIKKTKLGNSLDFIKRAMRKITKNDNIVPYYYKKAFERIKEHSFDYILAEGSEERCFNQLLKHSQYKKEQLIAHIHYHRLAETQIDACFGTIIAISDFVKKQWLKTSMDKQEKDVKVLMNGIDLAKFDKEITEEEKQKIRATYHLKKEDFVVLYCGRITQVKGVKELVQAMQQIPDKTVKLLIVGSPNFAIGKNSAYLKEIKKMAKQDKERIHFTGYVDNAQLYKYYKAADLMVVPSLWEEAARSSMYRSHDYKNPINRDEFWWDDRICQSDSYRHYTKR